MCDEPDALRDAHVTRIPEHSRFESTEYFLAGTVDGYDEPEIPFVQCDLYLPDDDVRRPTDSTCGLLIAPIVTADPGTIS